jgi:fumarate reductase subunit C
MTLLNTEAYINFSPDAIRVCQKNAPLGAEVIVVLNYALKFDVA